MLVLSRKLDERIVINGNIIVTVVDVRGDKVRLGITAPENVPVHRQEIYDIILREQIEAAAVTQESQSSTSHCD